MNFNLAEQAPKFTKVLVIKPRGIGDVVMTTPVVDNLRKAFPILQLDFLTERPSDEILARIGGVENVIVLDKKKNPIATILDIRRRKYDIVIDCYGNPRTAMITFWSGAKTKVGYDFKGRRYAYNVIVPLQGKSLHQIDFNLEALKTLSIPVTTRKMHFPLLVSEREKAAAFFSQMFSSGVNVLAVVPSGGNEAKRCDAVKLAEFAKAISEKFSMPILILWGKSDWEDAQKIAAALKASQTVHHLAPPTSITEIGAFMQRSQLVLVNNSGPMHIADAVGAKVLGLFGPTNPKFQGPVGRLTGTVQKEELDCIRCNLSVCPRGHECFTQLDASVVVAKAAELLART